MNKPVKKEIIVSDSRELINSKYEYYNQAWDDWQAYHDYILEKQRSKLDTTSYTFGYNAGRESVFNELQKKRK